jgi:hypothetical protein
MVVLVTAPWALLLYLYLEVLFSRDKDVTYNLSYPIPNFTYKHCSLFPQTRL